MADYQVRFQTITVGSTDYLIRSLLDNQQFSDPLGEAEKLGISSAGWSLFGQVWPSARVLAKMMDGFNLAGKRVLEIGAGLGLASLVVHKRLGDMTASDRHPLSRSFLEENLLLNHLGPMAYQQGNWDEENPALGKFDLIIGSDVLYERDQPAVLAAFIDRHSADGVEVLIVDPNRGNRPAFRRAMAGLGYLYNETSADCTFADGEDYKGHFLHFHRGAKLVA
ncbi:MAG: methyltransferase domain-containing protein [Azonexus sp.]